MASDPSQLMTLLSQSSGQFGRSFLEGQQAAQQKALNDQAIALNAAKLQDVQRRTAEDARFQSDWANYIKDPTTDGLAAIAVKYPSYTDAVKEFWAIKDPEVRQSHLVALSRPLAAIQNNRTDLAVRSLQEMRDAVAKDGQPTQDLDDEISALQSGNQDAINAVKGTLMMHLAAIDKDGSFAESLSRAKKALSGGDPYTLGPYDVRYDGNNTVVARGLSKPTYEKITNADGSESLVRVGGEDATPMANSGNPPEAVKGGRSQPLSVRLNNPGAIRFNPNNQWQGQVGNSGGFVQFDTPQNGARAHQILIANQIKSGFNTPLTWAQHYAPASDGNDPAAYAATIAKGLGIGVNDQMPLSAVPKIAALSARVESGGSPQGHSGPIVAAAGAPTEPGVKVLYTSKPAAAGQDAATVDFYGQKVAAGGDLPQLGMGKQAAAMRQAILARAAQIQQGQGMSGGDSNLLHADVKTATTALAALQKTRNGLNPYLQTFDGASAQVRALAPQGVGGSIPIFNRWIQAGRTSVRGDPAVSKFNVAINAVANENAKIMSGASGGAISSDAARHEAMELINNAQTLPQLYAVLDQMHTDTQIRMKSLDDRQAALRAVISGKGTASTPAGSSPVRVSSRAQAMALKPGTIFITPDGRRLVR